MRVPRALPALLQAPLRAPTETLTITVASSVPNNAPSVSPALVGLSLEQDRWLDWAGKEQRNDFFFNTLDNINQLAGEPLAIRIGADSEDRTFYNPHIQFEQAQFPDPSADTPYPEASHIVVGDGYYQATQFLPPNTPVTWGVSLGSDNLTDAFLITKSILKAMDSDAVKGSGIWLEFLEIGNEPDFYGANGLRPSDWNVEDYVDDWAKFSANISKVAGFTEDGGTKFFMASFAESSHQTGSFSPQAIFDLGILESEGGQFAGTLSQHRYSGSFCSGSGGLLQDLMTKSTIRSNLSEFTPDIAVTKEQGLGYVLGETNSYACHGAPGASNTAGAALWALDYILQATQLGIGRVMFHEGIGYKYNLIQPATLTRSTLDGSDLPQPLPPHIQPLYYAAVITAEVLGSIPGVRVSEIDIDNVRLAGYAFYDGEKGQLNKIVLINSNAFLANQEDGDRESILVKIKGLGDAKVKRLMIGHADDTGGVSWGGVTYETEDGRPNGSVEEETVDLGKDGVTISATEAVLITL